ncbi:MAG: DUF350 domain-containing protein [Flavobacteriales bacterium]
MNSVIEYLNDVEWLYSLAYIFTGTLLFFIGRFLYKMTHRDIDVPYELVENDNFAFSISYVGYFIAVVIIIGASIVGESQGLETDLINILVYGLLGILFLHISSWLSNALMFKHFHLKKEVVTDRNEGAGVIFASIYIVNALILYGSIIGEGQSLLHGISTFVIYWALANVLLVLSTFVYSKTLDYDIHLEIEKDNVAAGISFSGALLAIGIIIMNAISHEFVDWSTTIIDIFVQGILGIVLLPLVRIIADKILLPGQKLTDEIAHQEKPNCGAALMEAFCYIGAAMFILWSI